MHPRTTLWTPLGPLDLEKGQLPQVARAGMRYLPPGRGPYCVRILLMPPLIMIYAPGTGP